jgi:hypothetical protein
MDYKLTKNKVWKTLKYKRPSRKTPTGLKLGRLLDCSEVEIYNLTNYVYSIPGLVPRGSWARLHMPAQKIF